MGRNLSFSIRPKIVCTHRKRYWPPCYNKPMDKQSYQKVASYEVKSGNVDKVLLLYSGGLDTSVMLKWLQDQYGAKVTALTLDLGQQHDDLDLIKQKALDLGAVEA